MIFKILISFILIYGQFSYADNWIKLRTLVNNRIDQKVTQGATILVGQKSNILFHETFIHEANSLYDLASLTKVVATTTSIMLLHERCLISIKDRMSKYFNNFSSDATIEDTLRHQSGLAATIELIDNESYEAFIKRIETSQKIYSPRTKTVYSDLGFILLGELVQRISKKSLAQFSHENIFKPLQMEHTFFQVPLTEIDTCIQTSPERQPCLPHDPKAFTYYPNSLGHAGVFSTSSDLSHFAQMILNQGNYENIQLLKPDTVLQMTTITHDQIRGLGFDFLSPYSTSPRGDIFPAGLSFGHTGFTGIALWIDPQSKSYYVLLANRVFYGEDNTTKPFSEFRKNLSTIIGNEIYQLRP